MDYQAFARVVTPDYTYWNPIPGTRAGSLAECRTLAEGYARRTFVVPRYPSSRAERFLREMEIRPAPGPPVKVSVNSWLSVIEPWLNFVV